MIDLSPQEDVVFTARKHWFVFVAEVFGLLILAVIPFILLVVVTSLNVDVTRFLPGNAVLLITSILTGWLTLVWVVLFVTWTHYYLDMIIVTDKKIVEVDQRGLFSREVSSFALDRIQDITIDTHGLLATLLDFGDIHIQTAGENREFVLRSAARPNNIKRRIIEQQREAIDKDI